MAGTIPYSAEWYYKLYPGFYNEECYKIMADYSAHPEKYKFREFPEVEGIEETKDNANPELDVEYGVSDECDMHVCEPVNTEFDLNKNAKRKHEELEPLPFECEV